MTTDARRARRPARNGLLITLGLLRAFAITVVMVALYYLLPLDRWGHVPLWMSVTIGLLALAAVTAYQVRSILRAVRPVVRAIESLATTAPLFLLLFAANYFLIAQASGSNFNVHTLSRTDAVYFTVTVFATVGFGDIVATSQSARLLVTVQMMLDLIVLGLGVRLFIGVVKLSRQKNVPARRAGDRP